VRRLFAPLRAIVVSIAASLSLAGCASMPPVADRHTSLERAYSSYQRIRIAAAIAAPFLPPQLQATIATAEARADVAFALARAASSAADQLEQLRAAEAAAGDIDQAAAAGR
jgi:hypothetical protein